jgi:hypothetical protein
MTTPDTAPGRLDQIKALVKLARENDPRYLPLVLGASLGSLALLVLAGILTGHWIAFPILGVLTALLLATIITGRRGNTAALAQLEGQPGAAYAVLQSMRGDWRVTPAVAMTRQQDLVHRVIGRPGVVLVAEGSGSRPRELLTNELRKVRRVIGDTPMYDVIVGNAEGQVPLGKLQLHLTKLPRNLKPKDVNAVESRLKAVGGPSLPIPKGPMPKSARVPRGGKLR